MLYSIVVAAYGIAIRISAVVGKQKAKDWLQGRENWRAQLKLTFDSNLRPVIWIHASSTGEFEQGRTVIEGLRKERPQYFYLLTFFSPSGYNEHKDFDQVDAVHYLPLDGDENANDFIQIVNPTIAIFIKYEFWYHYFNSLANRNIPLFLVSAKLTENHMFFKWYGKNYQRVLQLPTLFFVQDEQTDELLKILDVSNSMIAGDTRVDRVFQVLNNDKKNALVEHFLGEKSAVIFGSSWEREQEFLVKWIKSGTCKDKIIIAPHEIVESKIQKLQTNVGKGVVRYTKISKGQNTETAQILIVDCVGVLRDIYKYGTWAFIGGGFSGGIHNVLEPSVFGLPVIFGPNYKKFSEAVDLIERGSAYVVNDYDEFIEQVNQLNDLVVLNERSEISKRYIEANKGATQKVVSHLKSYLK